MAKDEDEEQSYSALEAPNSKAKVKFTFRLLNWASHYILWLTIIIGYSVGFGILFEDVKTLDQAAYNITVTVAKMEQEHIDYENAVSMLLRMKQDPEQVSESERLVSIPDKYQPLLMKDATYLGVPLRCFESNEQEQQEKSLCLFSTPP